MIGFRRSGPSPAAPVGVNAGQLTPCHRAAPSSATRPSQGDERDAQRPPPCPRFWTLALEGKPGSRAPILGLRKSILGWSLAFDLECLISLSLFETERLGQQVKSDRARSKRAGLLRLLCWRASRWPLREAARVPPQASAAWPSLRSPDAGTAGFYAGARHGVARGGTCAGSSGGGWAVARALAWRGLRWLPSWRASRCGARSHVVADHERHARAGKAFNMHRIRLSAGAPHGHQQTLFIKTCVPKRDARAGASEALRLCKFRASVPSGSPLFLVDV